jgi:hypothetical protein
MDSSLHSVIAATLMQDRIAEATAARSLRQARRARRSEHARRAPWLRRAARPVAAAEPVQVVSPPLGHGTVQ